MVPSSHASETENGRYKYTLQDILQSGEVLCQLLNAIYPKQTPIKHINHRATFPYKMIENIHKFLQFVRNEHLLPPEVIFSELDLYDGKNISSVLTTLNALLKEIEREETEKKQGRAHETVTRREKILQRQSSEERRRNSFGSNSNLTVKKQYNQSLQVSKRLAKQVSQMLTVPMPPPLPPKSYFDERGTKPLDFYFNSAFEEKTPLEEPEIPNENIAKPIVASLRAFASAEIEDTWETDPSVDSSAVALIKKPNRPFSSRIISRPSSRAATLAHKSSLNGNNYPIVFGIKRGTCEAPSCKCDCYYQPVDGSVVSVSGEGGPCCNCGHYPTSHKNIDTLPFGPLSYSHWIIKPDQLQFEFQIGKGGFAEVWKGKLWGGDVAIKKFTLEDLPPNEMIGFYHEVSVLSSIRHPHCVLFMAATANPPYCIVTELFSRGSLLQVMKQEENLQYLSYQRRIGFAIDASLGMAYLHQLGIVHRDLKTANLLVDDNWNVAVGDFGLSVLGQAGPDRGYFPAGTCGYIAPELFQQKEPSIKTDIYSFGIVLWEIFTGESAYGDRDPLSIQRAVLASERPAIPFVFPQELISLIEKCWDNDPQKRFSSFEEITVELRKLQNAKGTTIMELLYGTPISPAEKKDVHDVQRSMTI